MDKRFASGVALLAFGCLALAAQDPKDGKPKCLFNIGIVRRRIPMSEGLAENLKVLEELGATLAPLPLAMANVAFPELPGSDCYLAYAWSLNGSNRGTTGDGRLWQFMRDQVQKRGVQPNDLKDPSLEAILRRSVKRRLILNLESGIKKDMPGSAAAAEAS